MYTKNYSHYVKDDYEDYGDYEENPRQSKTVKPYTQNAHNCWAPEKDRRSNRRQNNLAHKKDKRDRY